MLSIFKSLSLDDPLAHMAGIEAVPEIRSGPRVESFVFNQQPTSSDNSNSSTNDFKLSVADLNKYPEEVFDVIAKVGEG